MWKWLLLNIFIILLFTGQICRHKQMFILYIYNFIVFFLVKVWIFYTLYDFVTTKEKLIKIIKENMKKKEWFVNKTQHTIDPIHCLQYINNTIPTTTISLIHPHKKYNNNKKTHIEGKERKKTRRRKNWFL